MLIKNPERIQSISARLEHGRLTHLLRVIIDDVVPHTLKRDSPDLNIVLYSPHPDYIRRNGTDGIRFMVFTTSTGVECVLYRDNPGYHGAETYWSNYSYVEFRAQYGTALQAFKMIVSNSRLLGWLNGTVTINGQLL